MTDVMENLDLTQAAKIARRLQEIGVEMKRLDSDVYNPRYQQLTAS